MLKKTRKTTRGRIVADFLRLLMRYLFLYIKHQKQNHYEYYVCVISTTTTTTDNNK